MIYLVLYRQVMYINMTGNAVREQFHLLFVMRYPMAFSAIRDLAVCLVTRDAGNLAMLARCTLPLTVNIFMTATTGLNVTIAGETNLQRCVNPHMTVQTILDRLIGIMPIVAFHTIRDIAMLLMMTTLATLLCMGAGELLEFLCRSGMTIGTGLGKPIHCRDQ